MARNWEPCRVCGRSHTNPHSSSICNPCGVVKSQRNKELEAEFATIREDTGFNYFMSLSEEERWRHVYDKIGGII